MKNKKLIVILCLFIISTLALGGYIVYDKFLKEESSNENQIKKKKDNPISKYVAKINKEKDWVYDAEYEKKVIADTYIADKLYSANDIIVPYINIDSSYAKNSNEEIKKVFDSAIETYNMGVNDHLTYVEECNYKKNIKNDSVSVLLTYGSGKTDIVHSVYYTYNVDLKTGNKMTYEEIYKLAGFDSTNIDNKVSESITRVMKEKMNDFGYPEGDDFDTYNNQSIENYKKSIENNNLKYFIAEDGKLNIVVKLIIPAGTGEFDTIISVL